MEWIGDEFDVEYFNIAEVNSMIDEYFHEVNHLNTP